MASVIINFRNPALGKYIVHKHRFPDVCYHQLLENPFMYNLEECQGFMVFRTLLGGTLCILRSESHYSGQLREKKPIQIQLHKNLAHIYFEMPIIWTQDDPLKLRNSSSKSRCKGSCCFLYSYLELKKSEEFGQRLFLYVFLTTW